MATKLEETNLAPVEGAGLSGGSSAEKQVPESEAVIESTRLDPIADEKKVDDATAGVADLSVDEKPVDEEKTEAAAAVVVTPTADNTPAPVLDSTPAAPTAPASTDPTWPETAPDHPLTLFYAAFEALVKEASHAEVYGIELSTSNPFHTKLVLQKFLRANQNDLEKAKQQLLETLKWRKEFDPVKAASDSYEKSKFDGLGYIIEVGGVPGSDNVKDVVTFNVYGAVKDNKATFGDLDAFLRWRVGLMEKSVQHLSLASATQPIPNFGEGADPYQGFQVHDYLQVSFLRQDPLVKAATKKTIEVLGRYYPETLSRKFFVNVPVIMGWLYNAMKLVIAKETVKKFTVLSYGNQLATSLGQGVPKEYGGTTAELKEVGEGMTFTE
ncbi:CRAL/TRIO domain-containing protein [Dothidotthia symphoricarpi CBS 119687]|uniref:Phosphatidylinositol transfer protein SFH5 n=1 Tax=Dothidotthia symphoricarpi CBS 119687 TaxID=1392245 RepID=A0A6A6AQG4_9PLEO|nr:CRAL/TRIO domain-containing protein [Dothidotthia symphoricarpi CBS 119687]KAF2133255.1 CRAL/TRIO domain-containing protein [Dothidotthia symphoricarpi CBS 119687]